MLEVSAAGSSVLATSGAVIAAAAAAPSGDGAQMQDFSALLASAARAGPALGLALDLPASIEPETMPSSSLPDPPELMRAAMTGNGAAGGNAPGKNLPSGKLPTGRLAAAEQRAKPSSTQAATGDDEAEPAKASPDAPTPTVAPVTGSLAEPIPTPSPRDGTALPSLVPNAASFAPVQISSDTTPGRALPERAPAQTKLDQAPAQTQADRASPRAQSDRATSTVSAVVAPAMATAEMPPLASASAASPVTSLLGQLQSSPAAAATLQASAVMPITAAPGAPRVSVSSLNASSGAAPASQVVAMNDALPVSPTAPESLQGETASSAAIPVKVTLLTNSAPGTVQAILAQRLPIPATSQQPRGSIIATPSTDAASPIIAPSPTIAVDGKALSPAPQTTTPIAGTNEPIAVNHATLPIAAAGAIQPAGSPAMVSEHKPAHVTPITPADGAVPPISQEAATLSVNVENRVTPISAQPSAPVLMPTLAASPVSAPLPAPAPVAATPPTQDIAALVDRITEARAAAAPHTVRAALVHEDFGSVSLNFRSEAAHIHVTLDNADPGFAPAVQAAAATASLAGNTAGDDAATRRDAPAPQTSAQPQDAAPRSDAQQQQTSQQHPPRDRAPAAERQAARDTAGRQGRHPTDTSASAATPDRRGGIYA